MAFKLFTLLLLAPVIYANIEVNIVASENESERSVSFYGSNVDIISDTERSTFQLSDNQLKDAVRAYFGQRPDDAYVRSPTPWGDLYSTYNWQQVTRVLAPQRARILEVTSSPVMVVSQVFENNSTKSTNFKAKITEEVKDTITSTWTTGSSLTVSQEFKYGFDIKVASATGKTTFSVTSKYGQSLSKSETVTLGSESGVQLRLEPKQSVIAELYATRGTMKIQVDYEATLSGSTAVNYARTYKGHHFWGLDINAVMRAGGLHGRVQSSEVIELGYYSDSRVVIRDANQNMVLFTMPVDMY